MAEDKTKESVMVEALERFEESAEATDFNRNNAEADIRFSRLGEQWPEEIRKQREEEGRPCLTINKMNPLIRQVVNDARQNKPSIQVHPVDNDADVATSEVINGLIRSIERGSPADVAYDTAIDHAVSGGFGFFRIGIDYAHDETFDLEARIHRVPNPLMVHWDPNSTRYDAEDWDYAFVSDFLTEAQFKSRYPKCEPISFEGDNRDSMNNWLDDDKIRVAEYWLRKEKKRDIVMLSDGSIMREDQMPARAKAILEAGGMSATGGTDDEIVQAVMAATGITETRRRSVSYYEVMRRIINGAEVLEEDSWPGSTIPICPVWGDEVIVDGRRHFRSMTRDARDPQMMMNFWRSQTTELVALAPRAPWIGPVGFIPKGQEDKWANANTRSFAFLEYDPSSGGAPQRNAFAGVPAGALQEAMNAADDIKAVTGIYDAAIGAKSNETSGRAILARQRESDVSNFHFIDNLSRAIQYAGKVLVEIIPAVYSPRQTIRILGEDMTEKVVKLVGSNNGNQ